MSDRNKAIVIKYTRGYPCKELAKEYEVSYNRIQKIVYAFVAYVRKVMRLEKNLYKRKKRNNYMEKYYYQEGLCKALHYLSLNPVLYEKKDDGEYHKKKMACDCIEEGKCDKTTTCQLLLDAPETVEDKGIWLRDKKY